MGLARLMDGASGCTDCKVLDPRSAALARWPSPAPWPVAESPRNVVLFPASVPTAGFFNTAAAELAAPRLPAGFTLVEAVDMRRAGGACAAGRPVAGGPVNGAALPLVAGPVAEGRGGATNSASSAAVNTPLARAFRMRIANL